MAEPRRVVMVAVPESYRWTTQTHRQVVLTDGRRVKGEIITDTVRTADGRPALLVRLPE